ncbi:MAG TPA: hypothetical protein VJ722_02390, partial [Rhodanobacteraceae bacterium]|nr:hypothetical protein [Rhodanobacteraceae bacterium]
LNTYTLARLGVGASSLSGNSADLHREEIWYSFSQISQKPIFGHGIGYVFEWALPLGPHDMYLRFAVEGGMIGLAFYLLLMALLWFASSGIDRVMALQIILASFFSHTLLDNPAVIMVMAFLLARAEVRHRQRQYEALLLRETPA